MSEKKHTPGPWNVGVTSDAGAADTETNAHLIAAAPEMLEALHAALAYLVMAGTDHADPTRAAIRAAIKKANNVVKIDRARLREVNDEIRQALAGEHVAHERAARWRGQCEIAEKRAVAAEKRAKMATIAAVVGPIVVAVVAVGVML